MRAVMCFSLVQVPRCRILTVANSWWRSFHNVGWSGGGNSNFRVFGSGKNELEGGYSRRWIRRTVVTKTEERNRDTLQSKTSIRPEISDEGPHSKLNISRSTIGLEQTQYCEIKEKIAKNTDLSKIVTIMIFDIETTGLSRENERIIEIALQDLAGGQNSTFQSLVNPERYVPNSHIHGISTHMVNKPDVPRMKDLIPILLEYVESRKKPNGIVMWVAHNARTFDVPFLAKEFNRCSYEIPSSWVFIDTLPLAREVMKSGGSKVPSRISLQALREHYEIPPIGTAHRALSDVRLLALVLQRLTFDLKLPLSGLLDRHFTHTATDSSKKKKSSG